MRLLEVRARWQPQNGAALLGARATRRCCCSQAPLLCSPALTLSACICRLQAGEGPLPATTPPSMASPSSAARPELSAAPTPPLGVRTYEGSWGVRVSLGEQGGVVGGSLRLSQHTGAALFPALEAQLETKDDVRRPLTLLHSQGVQLSSQDRDLDMAVHTTAASPQHGRVMKSAGAGCGTSADRTMQGVALRASCFVQGGLLLAGSTAETGQTRAALHDHAGCHWCTEDPY